MRLAHILEDQNIRFTRLIRTESRDNQPDRIYLRVNTFNIHAVHHALHQAGFNTIQPAVNEFASK
jgi:acetoin utilization protein AcuB